MKIRHLPTVELEAHQNMGLDQTDKEIQKFLGTRYLYTGENCDIHFSTLDGMVKAKVSDIIVEDGDEFIVVGEFQFKELYEVMVK